MNFTKFTLGGLPECQKVFFHRTSFVCYQGGPKHYHAVLGVDLGKNTGQGFKTEVNHTSWECSTWVAEEILSGFTTDERHSLPWSCKFCGVDCAPANPTLFENRKVITGDYCGCDKNAPSFFNQAHTRIAEFIFQANKVSNLSWYITNKSGRKAELLLSHRKLGIALLSPHGHEVWGLVDFS